MSSIQINDSIFVTEAIQAFAANAPFLQMFSHNFNTETKEYGDRIFVPRVEAITATTFSGYSDTAFPYETSGGVINVVTVNLDQHFIQTCDFDDMQRANSSAASLANFAQQQGKALARKTAEKVMSAFTTANFGAALVSLPIASYGYLTGVSIASLMVKNRDVPEDKLSILANVDLNQAFKNDPIIYPNYSFGGDVARTGQVGQVAGMKVYVSNMIPTNSISLCGIVAHPDAMACAFRYLEPQNPGSYISAMKVADDTSGIVMGYRRHYSPGRGKMYASFETLFGFAVGLSLGIGLLTRTN